MCIDEHVCIVLAAQLQHQDQLVCEALKKKHHIIAEILNIPEEEFEHIAEMAGEVDDENKDARELVLAALAQGEERRKWKSGALGESISVHRDSKTVSIYLCFLHIQMNMEYRC